MDIYTRRYIGEMIWNEVKIFLEQIVAPRFWTYFLEEQVKNIKEKIMRDFKEDYITPDMSDEIQYTHFSLFAEAVIGLYTYYKIILKLLNKSESYCQLLENVLVLTKTQYVNGKLRVILLAKFPANFHQIIDDFYEVTSSRFFKLDQASKLRNYREMDRIYRQFYT